MRSALVLLSSGPAAGAALDFSGSVCSFLAIKSPLERSDSWRCLHSFKLLQRDLDSDCRSSSRSSLDFDGSTKGQCSFPHPQHSKRRRFLTLGNAAAIIAHGQKKHAGILT